MFPSPPNFHNPFESLLKTSSSLSSHENAFNFPSPFLDEHESPLNQIFSQSPNKIDTNDNITHHDPTKRINLGKSKVEAPPRSLGVVPRRRAGKKDRHSKICTAQGIRDRRMRLSLQVARKFFDLQDMLGYDKASKTIEWLFTQSKEAINELIDESHHLSPAKTESFVSECEEMSGIEETNSSNVVPNSSKPNSKESRDKARERARCRTREKMLVKFLSGDCYKPNPNFDHTTIEKLGSSNQDLDQEKSHNFEGIRVSPFESAYNSIEQQFSDYHSTAADYADPNNSSLMGFLGNWDERTNLFHYSVMNQVSYAGNLNSVFSEFP